MDFKEKLKKKEVTLKKAAEASKVKVKKWGRGKPLESGVKSVMRSAFGSQVDEVRIHTDKQAEHTAKELGARAFTQGKDIYFAKGEYNPLTQTGKRLLAHEITHVAQKKEAQATTSSKCAVEREADEIARKISEGDSAHVQEKSSPEIILMKEVEEENKTDPTISKHNEEITPIPPSGTVSGPGFNIKYLYNVVKGSDFVTLNLSIPQGIGVNVTPLTVLDPADYKVEGLDGTDARTVVISVSAHLKGVPKIQVNLNKGTASYIVVFQFPPGAEKE